MRRNNWAKLALWCGTLFLGASLPAQAALTLYTPFGGDGFVSQTEAPFNGVLGDVQRGIAYNAANDHVYIANRNGGTAVNILNGSTGASVGNLNVTGVTGGTFAINQVRVA